MPANYIYDAFFYQSDLNYVMTACCQILPTNVKFYDFSLIDSNEGDPRNNNFLEDQMKVSNCLSFKVYYLENNRYHLKNQRVCDKSYL